MKAQKAYVCLAALSILIQCTPAICTASETDFTGSTVPPPDAVVQQCFASSAGVSFTCTSFQAVPVTDTERINSLGTLTSDPPTDLSGTFDFSVIPDKPTAIASEQPGIYTASVTSRMISDAGNSSIVLANKLQSYTSNTGITAPVLTFGVNDMPARTRDAAQFVGAADFVSPDADAPEMPSWVMLASAVLVVLAGSARSTAFAAGKTLAGAVARVPAKLV